MNGSFKYTRLSKNDAACLLVDHQSGLISLVQDFSPGEFKNNVLALASSARYFKLPTILTTSFENGPNGPLVPELRDMFPDAAYIARPGNINAWDNEDFVKANEVTRHAAWARMAAAGVQLMNWFGVACELHRDWRNDIEGLGALFSSHIPNYRNLITSYLAKKQA